MAQFCSHCGNPLRPDDQFCSKCGAAVGEAQPSQPVEYEYCEVEYKVIGNIFFKFEFYAKATGPKGNYRVPTRTYIGGSWGGSGEKPGRTDKKDVAAVDELVAELVSQGWEPLPGRSQGWWSYSFRRATNAASPAPGAGRATSGRGGSTTRSSSSGIARLLLLIGVVLVGVGIYTSLEHVNYAAGPQVGLAFWAGVVLIGIGLILLLVRNQLS